MIEIASLQKTFGTFTDVADVSVKTEPGEVFGLLGPNGTGKSTTIGCLSGLLSPSSGHIAIAGHDIATDPKKTKARLGIVPQDLAIYVDLPARDNLSFWGAAYGLRGSDLKTRVGEVLNVTGLTDRANDRPRDFSGGMKRRLNFGCGIMHAPDVLLLDEPTVGVDPQSRERLFDMVRAETARGATVFYTTHHMEEAEALCDRIAIVDKGRRIAQGTAEDLRKEVGERDIITLTGRFSGDNAESTALDSVGAVTILSADETTLSLEAENGPAQLAGILEALQRAGAQVHETTVCRPNLESLFLKLTGRELRK